VYLIRTGLRLLWGRRAPHDLQKTFAGVPPCQQGPTLESLCLRHLGAGLAGRRVHPAVARSDCLGRGAGTGSGLGGVRSGWRRSSGHPDGPGGGRQAHRGRRSPQPEAGKPEESSRRRPGRLLDYCSHEGCRNLRQLDVDAVREFRNRLVRDYSPNSARKRYEYTRSFFRFCHQSGWITPNPAALVKPPRPDQSQTLPFDTQQFAALREAAETFNSRGKFVKGNRQRIRAMLLLLRYSGLRPNAKSLGLTRNINH